MICRRGRRGIRALRELREGGARKRIGGEGEARGDGSAADKKMQFYHNKNYKKLSTKNVLFGVYI